MSVILVIYEEKISLYKESDISDILISFQCFKLPQSLHVLHIICTILIFFIQLFLEFLKILFDK